MITEILLFFYHIANNSNGYPMKFKIFSVFALFFIFNALIFSQSTGSISGTVIDKITGAPIESADVSLLSAKDSSVITGTQTGKDGSFSFKDLPFGQYSLRANLVGYSISNVKGIVLSQEKPSADLDPIKLTSGTTTTEEILVESEKSPIQFEAGKKIFNVGQNPINQSGSLIDVLKNIPSVSVDADGNVSLRGNTAVKILVDGRPFGMEGQNRATLLEQIPANLVDNVEVITNPSSKYEAEGVSGIINIILKKTKTFGYNGNLSLNAGTGDRYSGSINLNLKNDKIQVFSNYNYNLFNFKITGGSDRTNSLSTTANQFTEDNTGNGRVKTHFLKGGLDYYINQQNTLGFTATYQNTKRKRGEFININEYDISHNPTSYSTSNYDVDVSNYTLDLASSYTMKFKDPRQSLTADLIYSTNKNEENGFTTNSFINPPLSPELVKEFSKINDKDFSVQSDYSHPFGKESKLETGFKIRYRDKENDYTNQKFDSATNQYINDPNLTNDFKYNDLVNAVYAQYSSKISIISWQVGTRVEQTNSKSTLTTTSQDTKNNYVDLFPSANLSAQLGKTSELQMSYSRRIRRPGLGELNPFVNSSDPHNYFSGNPNLKPEYTDAYELGFVQYLPGQSSVNPSVFYNYTKNSISRTRQYIDSTTTLTTFVNYASTKTYGAELIFNLQPVPFWNINGSVSYFKTDIDATNISYDFVNEGNSWSGRVSSSLYMPLQFSLQLNYFYSGKILAAQATVEPFQSFDAALRKDFFDGRFSATLKAADIFNTLKFRVNINNDPRFLETLERKRDTRALTLTFNYKFGETDKNQQRRRKDNNRENQNDNNGF